MLYESCYIMCDETTSMNDYLRLVWKLKLNDSIKMFVDKFLFVIYFRYYQNLVVSLGLTYH